MAVIKRLSLRVWKEDSRIARALSVLELEIDVSLILTVLHFIYNFLSVKQKAWLLS